DETVLRYKDVKDTKEAILEKNIALKTSEHENINVAKHDHQKLEDYDFKSHIPNEIKEFEENYDFLVLYDEWRRKKLKLNCYSILDSLVVHPDGNVPICQNLDISLGNINNNTLDEIFNGKATQAIQKDHVHNCNQCW